MSRFCWLFSVIAVFAASLAVGALMSWSAIFTATGRRLFEWCAEANNRCQPSCRHSGGTRTHENASGFE